MDQNLSQFQQFILQRALNKKAGLITVFSNHINVQKNVFDSVGKYIKFHYDGFVVFKNNKYPHDDLVKLEPFLKPNTIIFVNQIANSLQYAQVLDLSRENLIVAGFECFGSPENAYNDFLSRYQRISYLDIDIIKEGIIAGLYCFQKNKTSEINYQSYFNNHPVITNIASN